MVQVMDNLTDKSKRSMIYPFHKEGWKTMSGHLIISWMVIPLAIPKLLVCNQSLLLLDSLTGAQLEIIDMSHQMSHQ